ncbi:hypothetical protein VTN77DRAFT_9287 [Rasamsonia byssochlamydoides]|uniref:uncharacterized protein n=1 Tax=Rasamsonia byssochlamydoides TaxID=89139 RepID=UPI003744546C
MTVSLTPHSILFGCFAIKIHPTPRFSIARLSTSPPANSTSQVLVLFTTTTLPCVCYDGDRGLGSQDYSTTDENRLDPDATTFDFPPDHVWLETPSSLRFIHQVRHTKDDDDTESQQGDQATGTLQATNVQNASVVTQGPSKLYPDEHASDELLPDHSAIADRRIQPSQTSNAASNPPPHVSLSPVNYLSPGTGSEGLVTNLELTGDSPTLSLHSNLSIYTPRPRAPLEDPQMARLLRHYIDNLASWLDLNDPKHHFSIAVPHLALTCPMLLDAILAFSASHLSRDLSLASESALPLSTVILRMYEMLGNETDFQRHLRGCISLFHYNRNKFRPGSLQHKAFWTYVRQEILTALPNSSPTNIDTTDRTYYVVFVGDSDDDWTNNITWLAAKVINHYFNPQMASNLDRWTELQRDVDSWRERLPDTFRRLSIIKDEKPFPIIPYLCTWHGKTPLRLCNSLCDMTGFNHAPSTVIGMQFYQLCKVLLALHYPLQASGINLLRYFRYIETEISEHTAQLGGIVRGLIVSPNPKHPGTLVNAAGLLAVCGRAIKNRTEQVAVIQMLRQIETETAWPVERGIRSLEEEWDTQMH